MLIRMDFYRLPLFIIALSVVIVAALQEPKPTKLHAVLPVKQATECGEWK